jgi:hypothetical protein
MPVQYVDNTKPAVNNSDSRTVSQVVATQVWPRVTVGIHTHTLRFISQGDYDSSGNLQYYMTHEREDNGIQAIVLTNVLETAVISDLVASVPA